MSGLCECFCIKTLTIWAGESTNSGPMCIHGNVPLSDFRLLLNHRMLWQAVVAAGEASSRLGVLPGFWIIFLHDLLHAIGDGFRR